MDGSINTQILGSLTALGGRTGVAWMGCLGPKAGDRLPSAGGLRASGAPAQGHCPVSLTGCQERRPPVLQSRRSAEGAGHTSWEWNSETAQRRWASREAP